MSKLKFDPKILYLLLPPYKPIRVYQFVSIRPPSAPLQLLEIERQFSLFFLTEEGQGSGKMKDKRGEVIDLKRNTRRKEEKREMVHVTRMQPRVLVECLNESNFEVNSNCGARAFLIHDLIEL